ncbi:MAG: hypothetical protein ABIP06_14510 [Pyrinomonadaceae bacterium]
MNSEELELSLRTEFEEHLNKVFAEMRQELAQLQEKVEAEFETYKSQTSEVFKDFSARIETEKGLDAGFSDSVVEHLRLARDEGARITATAIAEAEEMHLAEAETQVKPDVNLGELRDAVNDISSQASQSSILKTLVQHAEKFTTRGAFFILKNDHFVGWRAFGSKQAEKDDQTVRGIFFPVSTQTVLGESVRSLSAVESTYGTYAGDANYLSKLEFGQPKRMIAIPLVARGRGVAVLYADGGEANEKVNLEALETLVRVAGLTVEVAASSNGTANVKQETAPAQTYSDKDYQAAEEKNDSPAAETYQQSAQTEQSAPEVPDYGSAYTSDAAEPFAETNYETPTQDFSYQTAPTTESATRDFGTDDFEVEMVDDESEAGTQEFQYAVPETPSAYESAESKGEGYSWNANADNFSAPANDATDSYQSTYAPAPATDFSTSPLNDHSDNAQYESAKSFNAPQPQFEETPALENSQYQTAESFAPQTEDSPTAGSQTYAAYNQQPDKSAAFAVAPAEPVAVAPPPARSRFSDRNVDLPIEVSEDERRLHNDARRFARLLVSEIKLYNEQKVKEGREASDLYERLREAIDRSREMYDKRVQPPVAAKFDYFHYELVNTLAEGEAAKLGNNYQGATT